MNKSGQSKFFKTLVKQLRNGGGYPITRPIWPKKPVVLIIRDGWGDNPGGPAEAEKVGDCPRLASTPCTEKMHETYPVAHLSCSGLDVGLPEGQMGNSEVGHLNLGARSDRVSGFYPDQQNDRRRRARFHSATERGLRESFHVPSPSFGSCFRRGCAQSSGSPLCPRCCRQGCGC